MKNTLDISSTGDKGAMPCAPTKAFGQRIINFYQMSIYITCAILAISLKISR